MQEFIRVLSRWNDFSSRAPRGEYWRFFLYSFVFGVAFGLLDAIFGLKSESGNVGLLYTVFALVLVVPSLAVATRRFHDTDRSAWWFLVAFIPFVGPLAFLALMAWPGDPHDNTYGPSPY